MKPYVDKNHSESFLDNGSLRPSDCDCKVSASDHGVRDAKQKMHDAKSSSCYTRLATWPQSKRFSKLLAATFRRVRVRRVFISALVILAFVGFHYANLKKYTNSVAQPKVPPIEISKQKFIRYECLPSHWCGGWADRLKGLFSTYAFSLILNRTFLVEMKRPCEMSTVIRPNQVNWDDDSGLEIVKNNSNFQKRDLHFLWNYDFHKFFESNDLIRELEPYDLISVRTSGMYMNNLTINPFLQDRIHELGYNASRFRLHHLFHDFYRTLFKLNDKLERKYQEIKSKIKPTTDSKLICAQVRVGGGMDPRTFSYSHQIGEFWRFIDTYRDAHKIDSNYMIYVTSDKENIEQEAKRYFGQEKVYTIDNNFVNIDDFDYNMDNCDLIEDVILDFHVLQLCDVAVVSHSGFGIMGAWNRPAPERELYVFTNQEALKKDYWDRKNMSFFKVENLDDFFFA